jgi:precorrin-6B C5,15-methyltransferase / cobalt-precorrin-6B C5,C15-methyltransferase
MTQWLTIIGMGEDGYDALSTASQQSILKAEIIVGSQRMLSMLPETTAELREWPQPFSKLAGDIKTVRGRHTVLLATGDPMNFGVARKIFEFTPREDVKVIPHLSAFTLAASRMGWSLPDCDCFTIHGRPAANLELFIQPNAKLLVLTEDETSVAESCRRLVARGFGKSEIAVLECMGGERERVTVFKADSMPQQDWSPLNTLAIHCIAGENAKVFSRLAGLPDDGFLHDGQLTKREVRAATLAALAPAPDQLLWDVGAGCGSVAIEWMRSTRGCEAIAIEPNADRRAMIATNADQLGTPRLKVVSTAAPEGLHGLPSPHAIFIGGGISDAGVFEAAWSALRTRGRLVANVVTIEGEMHLFDLQQKHGGDLVKIHVSNLTKVGPYRAMKPRMSVLQWRVAKP